MPDEQELIQLKRGNTKLGFVVMFKFFQYEARFLYTKSEIPKTVVELAIQSKRFYSTIGGDCCT
jgi:hypothetical protein